MMFSFEDNCVLENEHVILRPLELDDLNNLLNFSVNEPEIWKYSLVKGGGGKENMLNYIHQALEGRREKKEYPFIVFDKVQNKWAGSTRFYDIQLSAKTLQLGYTWYGKEFQGTGLNKHCKYLMLDHAFNTMEMQRVEFRADARNERSIAAMKSIGCTVEGVLRSYLPTLDGGRRDSIVLSILKGEWEASVRQALYGKLSR